MGAFAGSNLLGVLTDESKRYSLRLHTRWNSCDFCCDDPCTASMTPDRDLDLSGLHHIVLRKQLSTGEPSSQAPFLLSNACKGNRKTKTLIRATLMRSANTGQRDARNEPSPSDSPTRPSLATGLHLVWGSGFRVVSVTDHTDTYQDMECR